MQKRIKVVITSMLFLITSWQLPEFAKEQKLMELVLLPDMVTSVPGQGIPCKTPSNIPRSNRCGKVIRGKGQSDHVYISETELHEIIKNIATGETSQAMTPFQGHQDHQGHHHHLDSISVSVFVLIFVELDKYRN